ncbi:MAG: 4Fe-4S binding protein [Actinobacteria bacterium]|nr:4Fe-4S binding protein [Actinomycetota bacterium]
MDLKRLFKLYVKLNLAAGAAVGIGAGIALARSKPSTKEFIRFVGWHRIDRWPHGLFYLGRTNDYLRLGRIFLRLAHLIPSFPKKILGETYHGKLVTLEEAQKLVSVEEDIEALDLEQIVPYEICKDIILDAGDSIAVCKCFCRSTSPNHCYPDEVCIAVGEPIVSFVLDHQPHLSRKITSEEAMDILKETDEAGLLHAAFFKDAIGGRFYAICNCCKCCCAGVEGHKYKGVPFYGHSGLMPVFDPEKCTSCGKCVKACIFDVMTVKKDEVPQVDLTKCMGCAVCKAVCPSDAVTMKRAPGTPEPLRVDELPRRSGVKAQAAQKLGA